MTDIVSDDLRAGEVIQRLRSLLKRDETKPERLDLSKLTGEVLELARGELVTQRVSLKTYPDPDLPAVVADRVKLHQVLLTLRFNACEALRATPPTDRVLSVYSTGGWDREAEIWVLRRDPGLAAEIEYH